MVNEFTQDYTTQQTDQDIITPASGKKLILWQFKGSSDTSCCLDFATSAIKLVDCGVGGGSGQGPIEGAINEPLRLNCDGNSEVRVLYSEM